MFTNGILCIFCILFIGFAQSTSVGMTQEEQSAVMRMKLLECFAIIRKAASQNISTDLTGVQCPRVWDDVMCWPDAEAGTVATMSCPNYINGFKVHENATRECLSNGTWINWTNYSQCYDVDSLHSKESQNDDDGMMRLFEVHTKSYRLMYNIGFTLSLVTLILAASIMVFFKKLHCARNYIHLNLFLSFLLRAALNIIRDNVWVNSIGFPFDFDLVNGTNYFKDGPHIECRLFYTLYQYVLLASYMWIFVEAVYLHMVIFVSVFAERLKVFWFIILGWSLPLPFVITWAICRYLLDNTLCWNTSLNSEGLTWINKVPVIISVVLNFLFFINIVRLLFTKLYSPPCVDANHTRYKTLARSTLLLIPIFGVYYLVFAWPMDGLSHRVEFGMLVCEMFFTSYQGVIIAVLLCFANAEVRSEIKRTWDQHQLMRFGNTSRRSSGYTCQRETSCTRVSSFQKQTTPMKKYRVGAKSNTSLTDLEETVPFTNNPSVKTYSMVMDGSDSPETEEKEADNASKQTTDEKVELKIKFVNIECTSRDGLSRNTTSLDIQTLKNGCQINESTILNNNVNEGTESKPAQNEYVELFSV